MNLNSMYIRLRGLFSFGRRAKRDAERVTATVRSHGASEPVSDGEVLDEPQLALLRAPDRKGVDVRVLVLGGTGAGKTSMIWRALSSALGRRVWPTEGTDLRLWEARTRTVLAGDKHVATAGFAVVRARVRAGGRPVVCEIVDYQGGFFSGEGDPEGRWLPAIEAWAYHSDHLVVIAEPSLLNDPVRTRAVADRTAVVVGAFRRNRRNRRDANVTLMLAKADMLGSLSEHEASLVAPSSSVWRSLRATDDPRSQWRAVASAALAGVRRPSFRAALSPVLRGLEPFATALLGAGVRGFEIRTSSAVASPWGRSSGDDQVGVVPPILRPVERARRRRVERRRLWFATALAGIAMLVWFFVTRGVDGDRAIFDAVAEASSVEELPLAQLELWLEGGSGSPSSRSPSWSADLLLARVDRAASDPMGLLRLQELLTGRAGSAVADAAPADRAGTRGTLCRGFVRVAVQQLGSGSERDRQRAQEQGARELLEQLASEPLRCDHAVQLLEKLERTVIQAAADVETDDEG